MKPVILTSILIVFFLTGCATVSQSIDQKVLSQIKEERTTRQEVIHLLGEPSVDSLNSGKNDKEIFEYTFIKDPKDPSKFIRDELGDSAETQTLKIYITNGKVEKLLLEKRVE